MRAAHNPTPQKMRFEKLSLEEGNSLECFMVDLAQKAQDPNTLWKKDNIEAIINKATSDTKVQILNEMISLYASSKKRKGQKIATLNIQAAINRFIENYISQFCDDDIINKVLAYFKRSIPDCERNPPLTPNQMQYHLLQSHLSTEPYIEALLNDKLSNNTNRKKSEQIAALEKELKEEIAPSTKPLQPNISTPSPTAATHSKKRSQPSVPSNDVSSSVPYYFPIYYRYPFDSSYPSYPFLWRAPANIANQQTPQQQELVTTKKQRRTK
ncbi:MAG TPA: hypothetical protein VHZ76_10665 [Gammaproteobacteria bacterium]|jgi:hypothetical protein|nr:hypothetical protein [Gammaproteobacteria bacterium]